MKSYWTGDTAGYLSSSLALTSCASPTNRCDLFMAGQYHNTLSTCEGTGHTVLHRPTTCQMPTVVQNGWQPFAFAGSSFTPNGRITLQLWNSDFSKSRGSDFGYADANGNYEWGMGNTHSWDSTTSCGEHAVMIDQTTGYQGMGTLTGACFAMP
jgi:hypothetical protein